MKEEEISKVTKDWSPSSHNWTNSWPCCNRNSSQNIVKYLQCAEKIVILNLCTQQTSFKNKNEPGEEGLWERRIESLGLADANYHIQNR